MLSCYASRGIQCRVLNGQTPRSVRGSSSSSRRPGTLGSLEDFPWAVIESKAEHVYQFLHRGEIVDLHCDFKFKDLR